MAHSPISAVLDAARGVDNPEAMSARAHIAACTECGGAFATMQRLAGFTAQETEYEVPAAVIARAEAIFPKRPSNAALLKELVARLVYDSALDPMPAGARAPRNTARQFLYEAGSYSLDLHVSDEWSHREREAPRVIVVGQVSDRRHPEKGQKNKPVELRSAGEVVAQGVSNDLGEFHLESGRREALSLRVGVGRKWIEVPVRILEPDANRGSANEVRMS